jgi:hypothetical protein
MTRYDSTSNAFGGLVVALVAMLFATVCRAAEVSIEVSLREVPVGMPFNLDIVIENAERYDMPVLPAIDDLRVLGGPTPSTSSYTQIINGRTTRSETVTLRYRCVIERECVVTVPPISVTADGQAHTTQPVRIAATASETQDLLFVEVNSARRRVYLGETVEVTLEIWLRPYQNQQFNLQFDEQMMFNQIALQDSSWGDFADDLRAENISVSERLRTDSSGQERAYFVYSVSSKTVPRAPGLMTFDEVRIVVRYPERLARSRDMFDRMTGRDLQVAQAKPLVGGVQPTQIEVMPLPSEGKPATFAGAVGRFDFVVSASPTNVSVGDPITLAMTVIDQTPGGGSRLEVLRPPSLDNVPDLAAGFQWPSEALAGTVSGNRKTFMQSIRARDASVAQIPAIPFSYFDPIDERYVVVESRPIPLSVRASRSLDMRDVVAAAGEGASDQTPTELTEVQGGIFANETIVERLLVSHELEFEAWHFAVVIVPPAIVAAVGGHRWRARHRAGNRAALRRKSAARTAKRMLEASADSGAGAVMTALTSYIADRFDLPPRGLTAGDAVHELRSRNASADLLREFQSVLAECETMQFGARSGRSDATASRSLRERAIRCIEQLERERPA